MGTAHLDAPLVRLVDDDARIWEKVVEETVGLIVDQVDDVMAVVTLLAGPERRGDASPLRPAEKPCRGE